MFAKLLLRMNTLFLQYSHDSHDMITTCKQILFDIYERLANWGRIMLYHTLHWTLIKILL